MKGIIEFHDTLICADRVVMAEQAGNNVVVSICDMDCNSEYTFDDCSLADFRDAWRRALRD